MTLRAGLNLRQMQKSDFIKESCWNLRQMRKVTLLVFIELKMKTGASEEQIILFGFLLNRFNKNSLVGLY